LLPRIIAFLVEPVTGLALNVSVVSPLLGGLLMLRDHPCGIANPKAAIALLELRYYIAQITTILKEFNVAL